MSLMGPLTPFPLSSLLLLSLSPSVLPLLEVVACSEGHQVGIVCRSGIGYTAGAAHIRVAELVSEALKFICCEIIVIP